ncbi:MAG: DUF1343 domain-containing protein [Bacteroidota bacterium]
MKTLLFVWLILFLSCQTQQQPAEQTSPPVPKPFKTGAQQSERYLPLLEGKNVGLVVNQTSRVDSVHLVDFLVVEKVSVRKIFAPEHGFRGEASAGEYVTDGKDTQTGLPIFSLYGKNKKPTSEMLEGLDVVIFDIQDVGARFYTYISTLHYVMEACGEAQIPVIVLDRPNPNAHYVDGMVLEMEHQSFVGMHPIPVVHGCTVGELAQMINGEGWLENQISCDLTVISCQNYTYEMVYELPVRPSPNLPTSRAIGLYPSLCFFEGTVLSAGRGTDFPFEVVGHPDLLNTDFSFVPKANAGAKYPKHENKTCYGYDLRELTYRTDTLQLNFLVEAYQQFPRKEAFFNDFFTNLAGTKTLRRQIEAGMSAAEIRQSWQADLEKYKAMREKYLLYRP